MYRTISASRQDYWYDLSGLSLETWASGDVIVYLRSPSGRLLSRWYSPVLVDYVLDRQGSVTAALNGSGGLENTYRYDPWGSLVGSTGGRYNPYEYAGSYYDSGTKHYQMGARYYSPSDSRFTQADPLPGSVFGANRYAYTSADPVNATDRSGLAEDCELEGCSPSEQGDIEYLQMMRTFSGGSGEEEGGSGEEEGGVRRATVTPASSPVWQELSPYRGGIRTSGSGRRQLFYTWDYTHNDIEVWDRFGRHLGTMDPINGEMYKPPVRGRTLQLR